MKADTDIIAQILRQKNISDFHNIFKTSLMRLTIMKPDGTIIYDSKQFKNEKNMEKHNSRPEILKATLEGFGFDIRKSATLNEKSAYYASKINDYNGSSIILRSSISYEKQLHELASLFLIQVIFFIFLDFTIFYFYSNYLKRDLMKKLNQVKIFLENKISFNNSKFSGDKWLQQFWNVLKEWQELNLQNIENLNNEKILLNRLINSIDECVLLFDKNLNLITRNSVMPFLFQNQKTKYLELINELKIIELLKKSFILKQDEKQEIFLESYNLYLLVSIKYLDDLENFLLTIKNITQEKEVINIQKKFISNISHELKTPLTNVKGYLIALNDAPEELKVNFLEIIKKNIDILEHIIVDFLALSKLEYQRIVNLSEFSLESVRLQLNDFLEPLLIKKKGTLIYKTSGINSYSFNVFNSKIIKTDFDKLMLILKNLVENGFIYNNSKDPIVEILLLETQLFYIFKISDNGIGIPSDKITKIFERFYRVDQARTSNEAGTGLGLSIVKETIDILNGKITVSSTPNKGTIFIIKLNKI